MLTVAETAVNLAHRRHLGKAPPYAFTILRQENTPVRLPAAADTTLAKTTALVIAALTTAETAASRVHLPTTVRCRAIAMTANTFAKPDTMPALTAALPTTIQLIADQTVQNVRRRPLMGMRFATTAPAKSNATAVITLAPATQSATPTAIQTTAVQTVQCARLATT